MRKRRRRGREKNEKEEEKREEEGRGVFTAYSLHKERREGWVQRSHKVHT